MPDPPVAFVKMRKDRTMSVDTLVVLALCLSLLAVAAARTAAKPAKVKVTVGRK